MEASLGRLGSFWLETVERPDPDPPLRDDLRVDVAVVGAGITGLGAALALVRDGARVAVLEGRRIGRGATAYSTAKLTSLHGLTYDQLLGRHGEELARLYGEVNEEGIGRIEETATRHGIDCDFARKPNLTYTESPHERGQIESEVEAARQVGLPASYVTDCELPFPIAAAVRFEDQAEFHPAKYLLGVARALREAGARVYEETMAVGASDGSPCTVRTATGASVRADHVVVATHLPFLDRGLFFARTHPERSYVVSAELDEVPGEMYLSTEQPSHSVRAHGRMLLVGGESHKAGQDDAAERFAKLGAYARERFGMHRPEYHWATHDHMSVDQVPFVGPLNPLERRIQVATGYRKWGLALSATAAELIADSIAGRENRFEPLLDTNRVRARASAFELVKENANDGFHFFADRVTGRDSLDGMAPGEGRVVGSGLGQRAVYRDEDGTPHALSARCTHLGCMVNWNRAEETWDCACHGSRFARDGAVIEGPAVAPLAPKPPPG